MVEKDTIIKEKLFFEGIANLKETYKYARKWLMDEDYTVYEEKYEERAKADGKEIYIEWVAWKKLTDYYKAVIKINWKTLAMTDVEVETNGKRKNMNKFRELSLDIKGQLEKDYESKWDMSPFTKFFKDVYQKYVVIERTREKEEEIRSLVQNFKEEIKAFLEMTGKK